MARGQHDFLSKHDHRTSRISINGSLHYIESIKSARLFGIEPYKMRAVNIMPEETKMASNEMENETFLGTVCQTCTWLLTGSSAET